MQEHIKVSLDEYYLELQDEGNLRFDEFNENHNQYISQEQIVKHPYPGIRPFKTIEAPIFFGREGLADQLVEKLSTYNFLAVIGGSGSGKSSLVRAGLLPHLFVGYHRSAGPSWQLAICRPGNNPIMNLAAALTSVKSGTTNREILDNDIDDVFETLNTDPDGISKVGFSILRKKKEQSNLLIVIDQFEELFRFKREKSDHESKHFVAMMMNLLKIPDSNISIIITMRSEYLGECVQFSGLPEAINQGQYLVPRLKSDQIRNAIESPAQMAGKNMDTALLRKLSNEVGDDMDQLSILQHALMRTYHKAKKNGSDFLTLDDYRAAKEIKGALGDHADELVSQLSDGDQLIAQNIFKRITDISSDERGIRKPSQLIEILSVCQSIEDPEERIDTSRANVMKVIDLFRKEENAFLMPPKIEGVELEDNTLIDISHESLMRNWSLLRDIWLEEEAWHASFYKRIDQYRLDKIKDDQLNRKHQYLIGVTLAELDKVPNLNAAWASRYHKTKSSEYEALLEKFRETEKFKNQDYSDGYPFEADKAMFDANLAYFEECKAFEKKLVREKYKRGLQLFWMGLASALIFAALAFYTTFLIIENRETERALKTSKIQLELEQKEAESSLKRAKAAESSATLAQYEAQVQKEKTEFLNDSLESVLSRNRSLQASFRTAELESNAAKRDAEASQLKAEDLYMALLKKESEEKRSKMASDIMDSIAQWKFTPNYKNDLASYFRLALNAYQLDPDNNAAKSAIRQIFYTNPEQSFGANQVYAFFSPGNSRFMLLISRTAEAKGLKSGKNAKLKLINLMTQKIVGTTGFNFSHYQIQKGILKQAKTISDGETIIIGGFYFNLKIGQMVKIPRSSSNRVYNKDYTIVASRKSQKYYLDSLDFANNQARPFKEIDYKKKILIFDKFVYTKCAFSEGGDVFYIINASNYKEFETIYDYDIRDNRLRKRKVVRKEENTLSSQELPYSIDDVIFKNKLTTDEIIEISQRYHLFDDQGRLSN